MRLRKMLKMVGFWLLFVGAIVILLGLAPWARAIPELGTIAICGALALAFVAYARGRQSKTDEGGGRADSPASGN